MIETRLLRQFIAVAQELHFHRAALRLHMAQPALSQAINRLEEKLGFALLERDTRGVKLLPAGAAFLETAQLTLDQLERGIAHARGVSQGIAGTLTVTTLSIAGYAPLLDTLRQYRQAYPEVRLVIREMPSANQAKALLCGETDVALLRHLPGPAERIESRLLLNEQVLLALPVDHDKSRCERIELRDLADDDFVFTPQALGSGYHDQLIDLCVQAGFQPRIVQQAAQLHTLVGLVACGFGVALVPESIARSVANPKVQFRPIGQVGEQPNPGIGLYLSRDRENTSPLVRGFISLLEANLPGVAL